MPSIGKSLIIFVMFNRFKLHFLSLLGGALYASGFPMLGDYTFILGPIIGFLFLNWALESSDSRKQHLLMAWLFALGFYSMGFYWIPFLLKEFGGLVSPFNYLLGIVFSFVILPQIYLLALIKKYIKSIFLLSFIYSLLEYFVPQQFPAHLGHSFISLAPKFHLSLAPYFGSAIYSFIICILSLTSLHFIKTKKISILHFVTVIVLLILSFLPLNKKEIDPKINELNLRIVQPNIGNFMKVDSEKGGANSMKNVLDNYYSLSTKEGHTPIDLIIWPETAFPTLLSSKLLMMSGNKNTPPLIKQIIEKTNSEMFIGGYDFNTTANSMYGYESEYNAAFYFSKEQKLKDVYQKMQLIPFGEGLPFGFFNKFLSNYITNVSYFAKGERATLFTLPNQRTFVAAICYEILFPNLIRDILNANQTNPDFLINLTNDSWYGDTSEPYQHLFLSKWRALEFDLPIIRSTNTGITTIIFPDGSESPRLLIGETKYLDYSFKISSRVKTIYQKFGIWSFILFGIIFCLIERIPLLKDRVIE